MIRQGAPCRVRTIEPGETVKETLDETDCLTPEGTAAREYVFTAQAGQRMRATLRSSAFDAWLELRDEAGFLIAYGDDFEDASRNARIPQDGELSFPVAGKFKLIATTFLPRERGEFELEFGLRDDPDFGRLPVTEIKGCPSEVEGELTAEDSRVGVRGDLYPTDAFTFPGRPGQELTIRLSEAAFDAVMYVVSPSGALVGFSDDDEDSDRPRLAATLLERGPYTV